MYKPSISKTPDNDFYALIVRIDAGGQESVIHGYKGRHFKTEKAAIKSTTSYITKIR